jgi:hypothetical protein
MNEWTIDVNGQYVAAKAGGLFVVDQARANSGRYHYIFYAIGGKISPR